MPAELYLQQSKAAKREAFRLKEEYRSLQKAAEAAKENGDTGTAARLIASISCSTASACREGEGT